jgi:hypothetical protein
MRKTLCFLFITKETRDPMLPDGAKNRYRSFFIFFLVLTSAILTACRGHNSSKDCVPAGHPATPGMATSGNPPRILLFDGAGTSPCDVVALEMILDANHLDYSTANSSQLNGMARSQLGTYRLLIFPGGNFIDMGNSLTPATAAGIRSAVRHGLNYFGICAGGFLAGRSGYYNGLNLTSGVTFGFYSAEGKGIRKAALPISVAAGPVMDQYWEDGPQLTGWGSVIGKFPDGTPAIVEGSYESGCIILSGIHAEAPENWRKGIVFTTPAAADNNYAATLIRAALNRVSLPHY